MQVGIQGEDQGSHSCREHPPNPEMAAEAPSALSGREFSHEHSDTRRGSREGGRPVFGASQAPASLLWPLVTAHLLP